MDEMSWRARLAKSNINILNIDEARWYYEFMYHPKPGQTKWCKTFYQLPEGEIKFIDGDHTRLYREPVDNSPETVAEELRREVLRLRKELES